MHPYIRKTGTFQGLLEVANKVPWRDGSPVFVEKNELLLCYRPVRNSNLFCDSGNKATMLYCKIHELKILEISQADYNSAIVDSL